MPHPRNIHTLRFAELERTITAQDGESIFQSARRHGLRIVGACGGRGHCGTCVVRVLDGQVDVEQDATKWLRACQVRPQSDCSLEVAPRSLAPIVRAEADTREVSEMRVLEPAVISVDLTVAPATLTDTQSDADRIGCASGGSNFSMDLTAAQALSTCLRASPSDTAWSLRAYRRANEWIGFAPTGSRALGLAVDLGTTNVAAFLIDLETGVRLASLAIENPQTAWGADLISRINYAVRHDAARIELRSAALNAINALAHDLCHAVGTRLQDIVDVVICGNTAMHHLLLGLSVHQMGRSPFVATMRSAYDVKARDLGLAICPGAWVHMTANVGGFVGGDHVAALLATQAIWQSADTCVVMDIGTNTEISLIHAGDILSASCPSGPALEGGHISCGMRAAEGAIERVTLENDRMAIQTIGHCDPVGLCGSGVLDAMSVLRRANIVNSGGRLSGEHTDVKMHDGQRAAILAPDVLFTQSDVRAVQLAKAAIRTGVDMLLQERGLHDQDIEQFVIAGSFGAYIDIASGIDIGLFPRLEMKRFVQVGNAAGMGVRQMLTSHLRRAEAAELAERCQYIELSTRSNFQKMFLHHIGLPSDTTRK